MRALLDINVLIALLDADHSLHTVATDWMRSHAIGGWASYPITCPPRADGACAGLRFAQSIPSHSQVWLSAPPKSTIFFLERS